ncbi:metallophosphoesterase family protein [Pectobacterium carotovorum]|uniref:Calcineurin-like phosphoesterase domain-containing protein n=1 Tax=Pectobacterium carotovorum TaxID=554 RepID=A0A419AS34_PECCA|nr:metallophosphoesterase [Pectobacterium carotovorum]RJL48232.1 hypothetical protein D5071_18315 [Pectobacterium carotovorum]
MPTVFVHVSDIHFGQEKGDDRVHIHDDVKQQLISDARHVVSNLANEVAHGILVTGDIAHSGTKAEYDSAGKWLDQLASSIGAEIHCVQMVSGNHDFDRSKLSLSGKVILDHILSRSTKTAHRFRVFPVSITRKAPLNIEKLRVLARHKVK